MAKPGITQLAGIPEKEWLAVNDLEVLVTDWPADVPVNVVGGSADEVATCLRAWSPSLRITAIPTGRSTPTGDHYRDPDMRVTNWSDLIDMLTPRGSTIILDPMLGQALIQRPDLIERVALQTADRLLLPAFVQPTDWQVLYSEEFSFEEPLHDDVADHRWCWCVSETPAMVLIQNGEALSDHVLRFTVTCSSPGTFICRAGDQVQARVATSDSPSVAFSFLMKQESPLVSLELTYSGEPLLRDGSLDQRKNLYFSYSGTSIERRKAPFVNTAAMPAPDAAHALPDRSVRRALHSFGFYEVQTLWSPWIALSALCGVRSCFDYRGGFSFRDTDPGASTAFGSERARHYSFPAIWYQARRLPSPGKEWSNTRERFDAALASTAR